MNRSLLFVTLMLGLLPVSSGTSLAEGAFVSTKPSLSLDGALKIAAAATTEAQRLNAGGAIAVVDDGGHLLALERLDRTFPAASAVAIEKARTAAMFRKDTRVFEDAIKNGRTSLVAVDVMTPLQGGVPIVVAGEVVGAVGVSGAASAQQDEDIAKVAARALDGMTAAVGYFPAADVSAAFAQGVPIVETNGYKIHASRRERPGMAEVHERDTDIIHVLEGSATFVTGGTVVDAATTGPGEIRGREINGGETRQIVPGDVIVVPAGVPHWFKAVNGPFLYYVVKTT